MYGASLGIFKVHVKQPRRIYHSATACWILSKSDHPRHSYDVIYIFQDGGHGIAILRSVSVFVISLIWEGRNVPAYQISARYLNLRLRYYYFRFLKTNVREVGILLPVSVLGTSITWEGWGVPAYQISARYLNPLLIYYYFWFLKTNIRVVEIVLPVASVTFA